MNKIYPIKEYRKMFFDKALRLSLCKYGNIGLKLKTTCGGSGFGIAEKLKENEMRLIRCGNNNYYQLAVSFSVFSWMEKSGTEGLDRG